MVDEVDEDGSVYVKMNGKLVKADPSTVQSMLKGTYKAPDAGPTLATAAEDLGKDAKKNFDPGEAVAVASGDETLAVGEELLKGAEDSGVVKDIVHPESTATGEPTTTKKTTTPPKLTTPTETPQEQWEDLADQLTATYAQTIKSLDPVGGVAASNATNDADISAQAEADLGQSSTSPMAQWLNANTAATAAQSSATTAAEQAQVNAQDAGAAQIGNALQGLGQAEQKQMAAAPYQQLLQSLAADVPYQLLQGNTLKTVDQSVQSALNQIGLGPNSVSTGPSLPAATVNPANPLQVSLDQTTSSPAPQS